MRKRLGRLKREEFIVKVRKEKSWDLIVIGGGATGLGCAVDAASRGLKTLLLEQADFAKGTSSRSTKLIHGGLRYLKQGNVSLVIEALHERGLLCKNAPHLVGHLGFLIPSYHWWEGPFYGIGVKIYDLLAGKLDWKNRFTFLRKRRSSAFPRSNRRIYAGGASITMGNSTTPVSLAASPKQRQTTELSLSIIFRLSNSSRKRAGRWSHRTRLGKR